MSDFPFGVLEEQTSFKSTPLIILRGSNGILKACTANPGKLVDDLLFRLFLLWDLNRRLIVRDLLLIVRDLLLLLPPHRNC